MWFRGITKQVMMFNLKNQLPDASSVAGKIKP
jgi:hypothetical protein